MFLFVVGLYFRLPPRTPSAHPREGHPATQSVAGTPLRGSISAFTRVFDALAGPRSGALDSRLRGNERSRLLPLEFTPAKAGAGMSGVGCHRYRIRMMKLQMRVGGMF